MKISVSSASTAVASFSSGSVEFIADPKSVFVSLTGSITDASRCFSSVSVVFKEDPAAKVIIYNLQMFCRRKLTQYELMTVVLNFKTELGCVVGVGKGRSRQQVWRHAGDAKRTVWRGLCPLPCFSMYS